MNDKHIDYISVLTLGISGSTRIALYKANAAGDIKKVSAVLRATEIYMRKVAIAATILVALFAGSNGIAYAMTGETWVEKIIVRRTIDGVDYEVEAEARELRNGEIVYVGEIELESGEKASFLEHDGEGPTMYLPLEEGVEICSYDGKTYILDGDIELDITEDYADDGHARGTYLNLYEYKNTVILADFGRVIRNSLEKVCNAKDDTDAVKIAFTEQISGRAPEQRGNGLKFVLENVKKKNWSLYFQSGTGCCIITNENVIFKSANTDIIGCLGILVFDGGNNESICK